MKQQFQNFFKRDFFNRNDSCNSQNTKKTFTRRSTNNYEFGQGTSQLQSEMILDKINHDSNLEIALDLKTFQHNTDNFIKDPKLQENQIIEEPSEYYKTQLKNYEESEHKSISFGKQQSIDVSLVQFNQQGETNNNQQINLNLIQIIENKRSSSVKYPFERYFYLCKQQIPKATESLPTSPMKKLRMKREHIKSQQQYVETTQKLGQNNENDFDTHKRLFSFVTHENQSQQSSYQPLRTPLDKLKQKKEEGLQRASVSRKLVFSNRKPPIFSQTNQIQIQKFLDNQSQSIDLNRTHQLYYHNSQNNTTKHDQQRSDTDKFQMMKEQTCDDLPKLKKNLKFAKRQI